MEVTINQQSFTAPPDSNLLQLLHAYGLQQTKGVAVAVNGMVIPKASWSGYGLKANDQLTVIKAAQGG